MGGRMLTAPSGRVLVGHRLAQAQAVHTPPRKFLFVPFFPAAPSPPGLSPQASLLELGRGRGVGETADQNQSAVAPGLQLRWGGWSLGATVVHHRWKPWQALYSQTRISMVNNCDSNNSSNTSLLFGGIISFNRPNNLLKHRVK